MATKRLGKGLSALIPDIPEAPAGQQVENLSEISVSNISPNPFQPRTEFQSNALEELKNSIAAKGLITPITVRPYGNGYQLIAGERRLRAVQELSLEKIPAFVMHVNSDADMLEMALIENIQRENLNPIEEAAAYQRLLDECNLTQEAVAKNVGKDRATVANFLRLLKLAAPIQESVARGELTAGHARAVLSCEDEESKTLLWQKILKENLSVRQAEQYVKSLRAPKKESAHKKAVARPAEIVDLENKLRQKFGTQVHVNVKRGTGNIQVEFYSENDFERIVELLLYGNGE